MRRISAVTKALTLLVVITVLVPSLTAITTSAANAADPTPQVDIWTDKGGKGVVNAPGGTFAVGEEVVFYAYANMPGQANWQLWGPRGKQYEADGVIKTAGTYKFSIGRVEDKDIGNWQINFYLKVGNYYASDIMKFTVVAAASGSSSNPSAPTSGASAWIDTKLTSRVGPETASEFLAFLALRITEGRLAVDPNLDANQDGKITIDDVQQILQWAVDKGTGGMPEGTKK